MDISSYVTHAIVRVGPRQWESRMRQARSWLRRATKPAAPLRGSSPFAYLSLLVAVACSAPGPATDDRRGQAAQTRPNRTMVVIAREIPSLAGKPLQGLSGSARGHVGLFNSTLTALDEAGNKTPLLAEAVPQLNSDSWRVFPDGRMETTYRLRPALTWQDGTPLSAEDFVFAWRVYMTPDFGTTGPPLGVMEEVRAADAGTLLIRWRSPYPQAAELAADFPPLPRHLLEQSFRDLDALGFVGLPFWVSEYVGLGPYRVDRYEPGAWIEAAAFVGYVLGRPQIDRVQITFILDPSTAVAHVLAGEAHYVTDFIIGPDDALSLERQWQSRGQSGSTLFAPSQIRFTSFQFRPEVNNPPELGDVRVRKAIAHSIDNEASIEAVTYGKGMLVSVPIPDDETFWPLFERFPRYGFEPRRAQQLLEEAGYARGED
ncbi:MAG: 4-phytase, partial [Chloroflexi bacterium]|nr:4-phytase [Chloroflexota bacterium]